MPPVYGVWKTGVYAIRHKPSGKVYVGSASKSLLVRLRVHRSRLRLGNHPNDHLQSAWNKYGEGQFEQVILERCSPNRCVEREQHWIDSFKAYDKRYGYNKSPIAGSRLGSKHSKESIEKMAAAHRGKKISAESIAKRSLKQRTGCQRR